MITSVKYHREINPMAPRESCQELPHDNDWEDFLTNAKNKSQLITLLVDYLKSDE